jgi:hypothetical protein
MIKTIIVEKFRLDYLENGDSCEKLPSRRKVVELLTGYKA